MTDNDEVTRSTSAEAPAPHDVNTERGAHVTGYPQNKSEAGIRRRLIAFGFGSSLYQSSPYPLAENASRLFAIGALPLSDRFVFELADGPAMIVDRKTLQNEESLRERLSCLLGGEYLPTDHFDWHLQLGCAARGKSLGFSEFVEEYEKYLEEIDYLHREAEMCEG